MPSAANYLQPYTDAARRFGGGFGSLLWASPQTQWTRFDALARAVDFRGRTLCDVGCGRADLLDFLDERQIAVVDYIGLEAVPELAAAAERKQRPNVRVLRGDVVAEPVRLFVGAEVFVLSGSLNTMDDPTFYRVLRRVWDATAWAVCFNFLDSPQLAASPHLYWRNRKDVETFLRSLQPLEFRLLDGYLDGDCTMAVQKVDPHASLPSDPPLF